MAEVQEQEQQEQKQDQKPQQGDGGQDEAKQKEEKAKREDPRRKRTIRLIALAVLVVAILVSIPIYAYYSVRESTDDAQVDGHIIPISPRVSGNVLEVLVNDNQQVRSGEVLVKLDPADFQVSLLQAQAQLAGSEANRLESKTNIPLTSINTRSQVSTSTVQERQAKAGVVGSEQGVSIARARVDSARASLAQAEANAVRANKDLERTRALVEKDEISKQEYDANFATANANTAQVAAAKAEELSALHTLDQSFAQLEQSRAQLANAVVMRKQSEETKPRQVEVTQARFRQSEATIQQQKASVDQAKLNLDYTLIKAPIDGVVSRKSAEPGMQISAGQQLMALVPLDDIWITANFKETQLKKMHVRQKVEVEVDTYGSSRKYQAHIDSIAAASGAKFSLLPPENATGNYVKVVQRIPVKIVLEPGQNRDHHLYPGMSVVPTVLLNSDTEDNRN